MNRIPLVVLVIACFKAYLIFCASVVVKVLTSFLTLILVPHVFTSLFSPEQYPPYISVTVLDLVLVIVPLPQIVLQGENSLQDPQTQLTGQWWVLQSFTTLAKLSQYPPCFSVTTLVLVLNIFPPPQDLSHCENIVHCPHTQGTGQGSGLQFFITLSQPGQVPPYCSVTSLVLDLNIFPPPQDLSHCENMLHSPQTH